MSPNDFVQRTGGIVVAVAGVVTLLSAAYGESGADGCERDNKLLEAQRLARASSIERRERAWSLTQDAATAARRGDCGRVLALQLDVHEVDAEFHAAVFVRDVAIARCLSGR